MSPPREKRFKEEGRGKKPSKEEDEFIEPEFDCNVISGAFGGGGDTMNARRKYLREVLSIRERPKFKETESEAPLLYFTKKELEDVMPGHVDRLVMTGTLVNCKVKKMFVDNGNCADIFLWQAFQKMNLDEEDLKPCNTALIAFNGRNTIPNGYIDLRLTLGTKEAYKSDWIRFIVADFPSEYNVILERPTIHDWDMLVSTKHQKLKIIGKQNTVITIAGDQKESRDCYFKSVRAVSNDFKNPAGVNPVGKQDSLRQKGQKPINMVELDMRDDTQIPRPEPDGEREEVIIGQETQTAKIEKGLANEDKVRLTECLRRNTDVFAWKSSEILRVDPDFCCHKLAVYPGSKPIAQKKRKVSAERRQVLEDHVKELLEAGFIREIQYTTWLSNVVMVKKPNGKWRVCTDYTDLNKVCPKDAYPMPNIDQLVDNSSGFHMLSFMDAYSGYNQIPLHPEDQEKTAFIAEKANYYYNVMPFGLKNSGATYQRMINQVFADQLGQIVEVYIDDMIVKSINSPVHTEDLEQTFQKLR
ncbi:uncharacterized protein LOC133301917 [Gastrolobium bilobum]|uniref:uncharacterized protein LOC133301917 n=1 Tax=Gastrolobium bilobum TaxID=150636 RepID=UPI002AB2F069|nr:uncharacterized protein LOC133301917 [Gastrolobium bilobum]